MRVFSWIFVLMALAIAAPAHAGLQDISWSPAGNDGQILLSFSDQPTDAKVFVHPGWIDVDVLGVQEQAGQVDPAVSSDILGLERIPAPGGARFRIRFDHAPSAAKVQVFRHAVLVSAKFTRPLRPVRSAPMLAMAKPPVAPEAAAKARPAPHQPEAEKPVVPKSPVPKSPVNEHAGEEVAKNDNAAHDNAAHDGHANEPEELKGHDGEEKLPEVNVPKHGVGMIREASTRMARGLSPEQCDAAEKKVSADPWALDNLSRYGACLAREGKMKDAREVFERLITFDPETVSAYLGLGALAQDAGQLSKARDYYEEALSLGGSDAEASRVREMLASLQTEMDEKADDAGHHVPGH